MGLALLGLHLSETVTPFFWLISFFRNGNAYPMLDIPLYFGGTEQVSFTGSWLERNLAWEELYLKSPPGLL